MRLLFSTILLTLFCVGSAEAEVRPNIFKKRAKQPEPQQVIIPVYDTIRVVVTDTIKIEPKPAPRIDTLQLQHTPAQIDSLIDIWHTMNIEQSQKSYFDNFSVALVG